MSGSVLIYDETCHLIDLIKKYCGSKVDVTFCKERNELDNLTFGDYDLAFLNTSKLSDSDLIIRLSSRVNKVYINSNSSNFINRFIYFDNVFFFDTKNYNDRMFVIEQVFNKVIGFDL